jgi:hypothetical protein
MKAYQPTVLNTLDPYSGPQGYGMNRYTGQTIDQQTTPTGSRIIATTAPVMVPTQPAPAGAVTVNIEPSDAQVKPWYKSPLYIALLAAGAFLAAKKFKLV